MLNENQSRMILNKNKRERAIKQKQTKKDHKNDGKNQKWGKYI